MAEIEAGVEGVANEVVYEVCKRLRAAGYLGHDSRYPKRPEAIAKEVVMEILAWRGGRMIPDESDQINKPKARRPEAPKLQRNHEDLSEVVHSLLHRVEDLEERMDMFQAALADRLGPFDSTSEV